MAGQTANAQLLFSILVSQHLVFPNLLAFWTPFLLGLVLYPQLILGR